MAKRYELVIKLLLLGDSGVGKTCMITRFADDAFHESHSSTIGIDFKMKRVNIDGKKIQIQLWDTAGQEKFDTITKQYYRRAHGVFLVYDITNEKTFTNLEKWLNWVREYADEDVEMMLLANKSDMEEDREVSQDKGQQFAKTLNIPFYETSAKESDNIEKAFVQLTKHVFTSHKKEFDAIRLERADSDGGEFVSQYMRQKSESSCCQ
jgi:Ras-related protein Rab-15